MPNPRLNPSFNQLAYTAFTFLVDGTITFDPTKQQGSASVGLAVTEKANGTVGFPAAGVAPIVGQLLTVEGPVATPVASVQVRGTVTLSYDNGTIHNTAPVVNDRVVCDQYGLIKTAATLTAAAAASTVGTGIVLSVDLVGKTAIVDLG